MLFSTIIGQLPAKEKLLLSVQQNRVSHAQLFLGADGSGALALALAFAQYLNCQNKTDADSCGQCPSCLKAEKLIHPDIHFSFPVYKLKSGSENPALSVDFIRQWREAVLGDPYLDLGEWLDFIGAENKQGNISADECRSIIHRLSLKTFESPHKVMIIWMAEMLGKEGNIILKLLEEPPPDTVIILIAENRDLLLGTILSRCQIIPIPRISDDDLLEALLKKHGMSTEDAMRVIRQAEGSYREACRIMSRKEEPEADLFKRWMRIMLERDQKELINWIDEMARTGREKQKSFFRYALEFVRECILLAMMGEAHSVLLEDEKKMAAWFAARFSLEDWDQWRRWFEESHYHIERNAHPKVLFMHLTGMLEKTIAAKKLSLAGAP
jgi:DNA polymerase-3 subunit delta'